jgi:hypothetical protein
MAYARLRLLLEHDELSTYVDPKRHHVEAALTPDEEWVNVGIDAGANGSALTVATTMFTTVTLFLVEHGGASGAANVTLTYTDSAAGTVTALLTQGGVPHLTLDMAPASSFTLESADATTPKMHITILGT